MGDVNSQALPPSTLVGKEVPAAQEQACREESEVQPIGSKTSRSYGEGRAEMVTGIEGKAARFSK